MNKASGATTYKNNQGQKSQKSLQSKLPEKVRLENHGLVIANQKEKRVKKNEIRKYLMSQNKSYLQDLY
ncbi:unnamed protein product [Paramecium primaurelia]|uniref:Uncharacterized protein n=1 Tax=Paramecium primaurelia TaxID=5886 RepID=A0A8S1JRI3_PARPR|nr:unnamed protein product [Paramecium primaurelia]